MKKVILIILGCVALLVTIVQIDAYWTLVILEERSEYHMEYGLASLIGLFVTVIAFVAAFWKKKDQSNITTSRGNTRRRPVLEALAALKEQCDDPKIRLICSQMITNDGLNPVQTEFSSNDRKLLSARADEMKKVESVLRKVYQNRDYTIAKGDYLIAVKQLEGIK